MEYTGIINENEFFSQHYLDEIFASDIQEIVRKSEPDSLAQSADDPESSRPVWRNLHNLCRTYTRKLTELAVTRSPQEYAEAETQLALRLLDALKFPDARTRIAEFSLPEYDISLPAPECLEFRTLTGSPYLLVIIIHDTGGNAENAQQTDPLDLTVSLTRKSDTAPGQKKYRAAARDLSWRDLLNRHEFGIENGPRWVILAAPRQWLLLERTKFAQRRLLRFDWKSLFTRQEERVLKAVAVLLAKSAFDLESDGCRLDSLDENSFRHAQGVSNNLKYAMRRSIELLGNEAVAQLTGQKPIPGDNGNKASKDKQDDLQAEELTSELLRYMYRLLFIFFVESRPDLNYLPVADDAYLTSYSMDSLRELENVPLVRDEDRNGIYFHLTISRIFRFLSQGTLQKNHSIEMGVSDLQIPRLDSRLFDDERNMPLLGKVRFPNHILQQVIRWMSLAEYSDHRGRSSRRGRISYAHLGVNQLGAVYEALLSYQGFIAREDLYEVRRADSAGDDDSPDELDSAYFVTAEELELYSQKERVYDTDENSGLKKLRLHRKGSFVYRMSGRSRETSASYYTPETLTKCVVEEAIAVLSQQQLDSLESPKEKAERIISWRILEPAMGSAAFLNEAASQLAELYMKYAMQIPGAPQLTQSMYRQKLQQVKMYIADRNLYGVDLNPTAVELAEVSIWLNALSDDRFVPHFAGQLYCGNSLIGCRREAYYSEDLMKSLKNARPHPVGSRELESGEIWHFLVPSEGMAGYSGDEIKALAPGEIETIKAWRRDFCRNLTQDEIIRLETLSTQIETHWRAYAAKLRETRESTCNPYPVFQHEEEGANRKTASYLEQEEAFNRIQNKDDIFDFSEFTRIRGVMNYWVALWFWPVAKARLLPTRRQYIQDLFELINGVRNAEPQKGQGDMFSGLEQDEPQSDAQTDLFEEFEKTNAGELEHNPRIQIVKQLDDRLHFLHWPLRFADIFLPQESRKSGFDLILGNPPWATVTFETAKILGDLEPRYVIHGKEYNAKRMRDVLLGRDDIVSGKTLLERKPEARDYWLEAFETISGMQNFFKDQKLYPELAGCGNDLFKVFLPNVWRNAAEDGAQGLLHPETPYTETKGLALRKQLYQRVRRHYQFANEMKLFADVDHHTKFSVNVYGQRKDDPDFVSMNNLFLPRTIRESDLEAREAVEGIKNTAGEWNVRGHPERKLHFDGRALADLAAVFGTDPAAPILPNIHAAGLLSLLEHFARCPRLGSFEHYISRMWDETNAQKDGTIGSFAGNHTRFPGSPGQAVINAVHLYVGNPLYT